MFSSNNIVGVNFEKKISFSPRALTRALLLNAATLIPLLDKQNQKNMMPSLIHVQQAVDVA